MDDREILELLYNKAQQFEADTNAGLSGNSQEEIELCLSSLRSYYREKLWDRLEEIAWKKIETISQFKRIVNEIFNNIIS